MVDKAITAGTTTILAVTAHPQRTLLSFTNTGAADEIVSVSTTSPTAANSAWKIYNRETLKMTLDYAVKAWYIYATANVTVNISEEF